MEIIYKVDLFNIKCYLFKNQSENVDHSLPEPTKDFYSKYISNIYESVKTVIKWKWLKNISRYFTEEEMQINKKPM